MYCDGFETRRTDSSDDKVFGSRCPIAMEKTGANKSHKHPATQTSQQGPLHQIAAEAMMNKFFIALPTLVDRL